MASSMLYFSIQRNWRQAALFYLIFLIFSAVMSLIGALVMVSSGAIPPPDTSHSFQGGFSAGYELGRSAKVSPYIDVAFSGALSVIILHAKKLYNLKGISCAIVGIVLALMLGGFAGLVPPAYLTMQPNLKDR